MSKIVLFINLVLSSVIFAWISIAYFEYIKHDKKNLVTPIIGITYVPSSLSSAPDQIGVKFNTSYSLKEDPKITSELVYLSSPLVSELSDTLLHLNLTAAISKIVIENRNFSFRAVDFMRHIEKMETQVARRDKKLSHQATEIAKLRQEVQKLEGIRASLYTELALYEKPRKLNKIIELLKTADFAEANQIYNDISSKFTLTEKERKRLEVVAIESVRPIPASNKSSNRAGYLYLVNLFPENKYYQNKLASYAK